MDIYDILLAKKMGGGGGSSVTVEPLSVTQNGTYTAPTGTAYDPVEVNVSGGSSVEAKDVNFYDYDGTLLYSYTAQEFADLQELPENPSHDGLTAQGWNWTLQEIKAQLSQTGGDVEVGQTYITDDGKTRLYCDIDEYTLSVVLGLGLNGTVEVDWGDNSATSTMTGNTESYVTTATHTYSSAGSYVITLSLNGSMSFLGNSTSSRKCPYILNSTASPYTSYEGRKYYNCIKKIEIGLNVKIPNYALRYLGCLETITIPNGITAVGNYGFDYCVALKHITFPRTVETLGDYAVSNIYAMKSISLPYGLTSQGEYCFQNDDALKRITIPQNITSLPNYLYSNLLSLERIAVPSSVTAIGTQMFSYDLSIKSAIINTTTIGNSFFNSCSNLLSVIINGQVTMVNVSAFAYCSSLKVLTFPSSLTEINGSALSYCAGMNEYHFKSVTPPTLANTNVFENIPASCVIYVPAESVDAYKTASNWSSYANKIQGE